MKLNIIFLTKLSFSIDVEPTFTLKDLIFKINSEHPEIVVKFELIHNRNVLVYDQTNPKTLNDLGIKNNATLLNIPYGLKYSDKDLNSIFA
jgi:hypothetical protein